jgi:hypothetical protein
MKKVCKELFALQFIFQNIKIDFWEGMRVYYHERGER